MAASYPGLYPFQVEGVDFIVEKKRCLLGDTMGLGKTVQALAACNELQLKNVLVVCPKAIKLKWKDEIEHWVGDVDITVVTGRGEERVYDILQKAQFTVVNYEQMVYHHLLLITRKYDAVIFDEAHMLKSRKSKRTKTAMKLVRELAPSMLLFLTGTPIANYPDDLWTLLHMLQPDRFTSYWEFVKTFLVTRSVRGARWETHKVVGIRNEAYFAKVVSPYYLRREKHQVFADLPPVTKIIIPVELEGRQLNEYCKMEQLAFASITDVKEVTVTGVLARHTRLKQIAISLDLLDKTSESLDGAKKDTLQELLYEASDERVVVFSQFATVVDRLLELLYGDRTYFTYTGDMKELERYQTLASWEETKNGVLLVSMKAGGMGLDLQSASTCIFMDRHSAPYVNDQALGRLDRIGQKLPVTSYYLQAVNTVDDDIHADLLVKELLARFMMDADHFMTLLKGGK